MNLILCHTTADFDALGAAVGLTRLLPGSKIVLTGGTHPPVRDFLALYRDEYPLIERRAVNPKQIRSLIVVDAQQRDRLGKAAEWLDLPDVREIIIYDHHLGQQTDIPATQFHLSPVGAVTTLIVEQLQERQITLTPAESTVMALGIHVDTGSLTFDHTTPRDALALAWLMQQGVNLAVITEYVSPALSSQLQHLLTEALQNLESLNFRGYTIAWVTLKTDDFVPGLSNLASQLVSLSEIDALLLAHEFLRGNSESRLTLIGRSQIPATNLNQLFQKFGGGGQRLAASLSLRGVDREAILKQLLEGLKSQIPQPPNSRDLMSSPVRSIRPETTIEEAQRILLRYGDSGLCVVDAEDKLVGIISRRDIDIALHHSFSHAPVKGYMTTNLHAIAPSATLPEIQALMVTYDIGRLPVLDSGQLVGIVTRTDVLREMHQGERKRVRGGEKNIITSQLQNRLAPELWKLLSLASQEAEKRGWHLYIVGGAVRDLLLAKDVGSLMLPDIDLVVDGFHQSADVGAGVQLAKALQKLYPAARLDIHGAFQTAALLWHKDEVLDSLAIDIATARTEFYPYPAANPEVEASSIRQDLYRRDFTINAMALRLTPPRAGELLDFFGGLLDLEAKQIRVLHPNSFIEDPTRIYRGVRFAVRLGFEIEAQTESYIRYAINSGIYVSTAKENSKTPALQTRLKAELKYLLQAPYWKSALELLSELGALQCIHPTLKLDEELLRQLRLMERCLRRFDFEQTLIPGQIRLEAIIAHLAPEYRAKVARNLQLPDESIKRLISLPQNELNVNTIILKQGGGFSVDKCGQPCLGDLKIRTTFFVDGCPHLSRLSAGEGEVRPSQVVQLLRRYDLPMLILIAVQSQKKIRQIIWQYLTVWRYIQSPLNGNDLIGLGYKKGPQFKQILDDLLAASLDGVIKDRDSAENFLLTNVCPLPPNSGGEENSNFPPQNWEI